MHSSLAHTRVLLRHRRRLLEGRERGNEPGRRVRRHRAHQNAEPAVVCRGPRAQGTEGELQGERHRGVLVAPGVRMCGPVTAGFCVNPADR